MEEPVVKKRYSQNFTEQRGLNAQTSHPFHSSIFCQGLPWAKPNPHANPKSHSVDISLPAHRAGWGWQRTEMRGWESWTGENLGGNNKPIINIFASKCLWGVPEEMPTRLCDTEVCSSAESFGLQTELYGSYSSWRWQVLSTQRLLGGLHTMLVLLKVPCINMDLVILRDVTVVLAAFALN